MAIFQGPKAYILVGSKAQQRKLHGYFSSRNIPLAKILDRVYNADMRKQRPSPNGKRAKPKKKATAQEPDPEWEHLEERFNSLNADFGKLAELIERE